MPPILQPIQDKHDLLGTDAEAKTNTLVTFFNGYLHIDKRALAAKSDIHKLCLNTVFRGPTKCDG